jgi:hypothetical protein
MLLHQSNPSSGQIIGFAIPSRSGDGRAATATASLRFGEARSLQIGTGTRREPVTAQTCHSACSETG